MAAGSIKSENYRVWMTIDVPTAYVPTGSLIKVSIKTVTLDVSSFSAQFAVNAIPQATCSIAMGKQIPNTDKISEIHQIIDVMQYRAKASVYMQVDQRYSDVPEKTPLNKDDAFNSKPFIVFEGYTSGSGFRRSSASVEYVLSIEHWLSDLNNASALSPDIVPGTPFNLFFPSNGITPEAQNAPGLGLSKVRQIVTSKKIKKDMWQAILDYFKAVSSLNSLSKQSSPILPIGSSLIPNVFFALKNDAALASLNKFDTPEGKFYKKIAIRSDSELNATADKILQTIHGVTLTSFDGSTIWDNLINFGANLQFGISPAIRTAWVFPKLPNSRQEYITIYDSEINSFDVSTSMPRFIGGIIIKGIYGVGSGFSNIGASTGSVPAPVLTNFSSCMYFSKRYLSGQNIGAVLMQKAPNWLTTQISSKDIIAIQPITQQQIDVAQSAEVKVVAQEIEAINTAYARSVYNTEILKYRRGVVSGKFRLDIAPGSIVKIIVEGDSGIIKDKLNRPMYASVDQVSVSIDAIAGQASTSFVVSSVRSEVENVDDDLTSINNPLYTEVWKGAPLFLRVYEE